MKVKCIKNVDILYSTITIGKTYDVLYVIDNWYYIINNDNNLLCYNKNLFELVLEAIK